MNDNRLLRPRGPSGSLRNLQGPRWCGLLSGCDHTLALTSPGASLLAPASVRSPHLSGNSVESSAVSSRRWRRSFPQPGVAADVLAPESLVRGWCLSYRSPGQCRQSIRETYCGDVDVDVNPIPERSRYARQRNVESAKACNDTRASDHSKNHRDTPASTFCHFTLKAEKPKDSLIRLRSRRSETNSGLDDWTWVCTRRILPRPLA